LQLKIIPPDDRQRKSHLEKRHCERRKFTGYGRFDLTARMIRPKPTALAKTAPIEATARRYIRADKAQQKHRRL